MTFNNICSTTGLFIGGGFSESLLLLLISFIKSSSSSGFSTMYLVTWDHPRYVSSFSTLIMITPEPLILGRIFLSCISLSLLFYQECVESIFFYFVPFFAIYLALYSEYVSLRVTQLFLHNRYYFLAFFFWWMISVRSIERNHLLIVIFENFVTVFRLIFLSL